MTKKQTAILVLSILLLLIVIGAILSVVLGTKESGIKGNVKNIKVIVNHRDGSKKTVNIRTKSEYLRGALDEKKLIAGIDNGFGINILTVDGESIQDARIIWWGITKNGEKISGNVNEISIEDGDVYEFSVETQKKAIDPE